MYLFLESSGLEAPESDFITLDRAFSESQGLSVNASSHVLQLNGTQSVETYVSVLEKIQFGSTALEPLSANRIVGFSVKDDDFTSNTVAITITIDLINDNIPVLDLSSSTDGFNFETTFVEDGFFVFAADSDATVTDADGGTIEYIRVYIENPLDGNLEQISTFSTSRDITVQQNSTGLYLIGPALTTSFESTLRSITYQNSADEPSEPQTERLIQFQVSDGFHLSSPVTTSIIIQPVNDPPSILLGSSTRDVILTYP